MALFTAIDQADLDQYRLIEHYLHANNKWKYDAEGKHVYRALYATAVPTAVELEDALSLRLALCDTFVRKMGNDHPLVPPHFYPNRALARYMLDFSWVEFLKP